MTPARHRPWLELVIHAPPSVPFNSPARRQASSAAAINLADLLISEAPRPVNQVATNLLMLLSIKSGRPLKGPDIRAIRDRRNRWLRERRHSRRVGIGSRVDEDAWRQPPGMRGRCGAFSASPPRGGRDRAPKEPTANSGSASLPASCAMRSALENVGLRMLPCRGCFGILRQLREVRRNSVRVDGFCTSCREAGLTEGEMRAERGGGKNRCAAKLLYSRPLYRISSSCTRGTVRNARALWRSGSAAPRATCGPTLKPEGIRNGIREPVKEGGAARRDDRQLSH